MAITIEPRRRGAPPSGPAHRDAPPRRSGPRPDGPPPGGGRGGGPGRPPPPIRPAGRPRPRRTRDGSRPLSAGAVVIVGVIVYVVAGLLNSGSLLRRAQTQADTAPLKGVTEGIARPLDTVAGWFRLDAPAQAVADIRGTDTDDDTTFDDLAAPTDESGAAAQPAAGSADAAADGGTVPAAGAGTATGPVATTAAPAPTLPPGQPVLHVPSEANPLKVYVAGDSLVGGWGAALQNLAGGTQGIDVDLDYKVSSGLVRTDFYNWPGRLKEQIEKNDPDVVVLGFGGNDTQQMRVDGKSIPVTDPRWQEEYRRRVGAVMDYVNRDGRKLIWVGTPNHPDPDRTAQLKIIDAIFREEAAGRPNITFVDTWKRFAAPDGGYAAYIADANGEYRPVRATSDGFHLNLDGVTILGSEVLTEINNAVAQYS